MSREAAEQKVRDAFDAVIEGASPYLEFLVDEINPNATNTDLEKRVVEIGTLAVGQTPMQHEDLVARLLARFPKAPKKTVRKVFRDALAAADLRRRTAAAKGEKDAGEPGADGAMASPTDEAPFRSELVDALDHYVRKSDGEKVTTFALAVTRTIIPPDGGQHMLEVDAFTRIGTTFRTLATGWRIPAKAWTSKREFIKSFPSYEMQFSGTDDDVQGLQHLLTRGGLAHLPCIQATNKFGAQTCNGAKRWVLEVGTLDCNGWMKEPDLVYVADGGSNLAARLHTDAKHDLDTHEIRKMVVDFCAGVLRCHAPTAMAAWNGWMMATLFKPYLRTRLDGFPIAMIAASPGAGKTSLGRMLWAFYAGVKLSVPCNANATTFAMARDMASATSIAMWWDELKFLEMQAGGVPFTRVMKRGWGGDTDARGHSDQTVTVYPSIVPIMCSGEQAFEDPAMLERMALVRLDRNWLRQHPESVDAYESIGRRELWKCGAYVARWSLGVDEDTLYAKAHAAVGAALLAMGRVGVPDRVRTNLMCVAFGMLTFEALAASVDVTPPAVDFHAVMLGLLANVLQEDDKGMPSVHTRNAFDQVMIEIVHAARAGILKEGRDYELELTKNRVWISLPSCLRALEAWFKSMGRPIPWPGDVATTIIAREIMQGDGYVMAVGERRYMKGGGRVRCIGIDLAKIPASLPIEDFPTPSNGEGVGAANVQLWNKYARHGEGEN